MRRRDLIVGIAGSAAAWPLAVRAQQASGMRRIGVFTGAASSNPEVQARYAAFLQALQNLGWIEGHNLKVDYRFGAGNVDDTRKYVAELVALAPDVIVSIGSASTGQLQRATRIVPIVFTIVPDPVPVVNQIRAYWWCRPPRIGCGWMRPAD